MNNVAIIVENRPSVNVKQIIEQHARFLPDWQMVHISHPIKSGHDYNRLLTTKDFWTRWAEHYRVLLFQHDSALLRYGIDEFLQWDYVGAPWRHDAPWAHPERKGGNGGFSIRNPRMMLSVLNKYNYNPSKHGNEDVFFVHHLEKVGGKVAPFEVCRKFACEAVFQLGTLGYHAIESHLNHLEVKEIKEQYDFVSG